MQLAPCLSSRLRHSVRLPPSSSFCSPLLSRTALLLPPHPPAAPPDHSSIICISLSLIILQETDSWRVGHPDFVRITSVRVIVCVQAGEGGRREGGVYPSTEPVVVTNRAPAASHYFTAAALSPAALSEPDTLTCLSPPLSSLCIFSRAARPSAHQRSCHSCGVALCSHWPAPHPLILHDCHKGKAALEGGATSSMTPLARAGTDCEGYLRW